MDNLKWKFYNKKSLKIKLEVTLSPAVKRKIWKNSLSIIHMILIISPRVIKVATTANFLRKNLRIGFLQV